MIGIIFLITSSNQKEIKTFLPYKVIEVETAEADDIIATLIKSKEYAYA